MERIKKKKKKKNKLYVYDYVPCTRALHFICIFLAVLELQKLCVKSNEKKSFLKKKKKKKGSNFKDRTL